MSHHHHENQHHHHHGEEHSSSTRRPIHHSWIFWVAVFLMLAAMIIYVMTGDLSWIPGRAPTQ